MDNSIMVKDYLSLATYATDYNGSGNISTPTLQAKAEIEVTAQQLQCRHLKQPINTYNRRNIGQL